MAQWLADWLKFRLTHWQASLLEDQLAGWVVIGMVGKLADMLDIRLLSWQPCLLAGFMASLQVDWLKFRLIGWVDGLMTSQKDCWLMVYWLYIWFSSLLAFWRVGYIAVLLANCWDIILTSRLARHMTDRLAVLFVGYCLISLTGWLAFRLRNRLAFKMVCWPAGLLTC